MHELLDWSDIPGEWKAMFADYQMHLLEVKKIENLEKYHSDLKLLFGVLKYREDKEKMTDFISENEAAFKDVSADLASVIYEYSHSQEIFKIIEEKRDKTGRRTVNMCKAFLEMIEDGRKAGREEGREEGRREGMELYGKQFGELVLYLLSEDRTEELKKASKDSIYRQQLMDEYGIAG